MSFLLGWLLLGFAVLCLLIVRGWFDASPDGWLFPRVAITMFAWPIALYVWRTDRWSVTSRPCRRSSSRFSRALPSPSTRETPSPASRRRSS